MNLGVDFTDPGLESEVRSGLLSVEGLLRDTVKSDYPFVTETSLHLVDAGGKRFRPLLVLLAAHFGDAGAPGVLPAAVVVELTHLATLYHDDVMDDAPMRRGAVSANNKWGNSIAILTGDFLFAKASQLLADLGPECVRIQARTFERLVHGQIRETAGPEPSVDPVEDHLRVLADKTGSLIGTCGRFGAMLSGADEGVTETLCRFGEKIGVAFQLSDDLLDVASDAGQSGKAPGTDLRAGVRTLPVLYALASGDEFVVTALSRDLGSDDALAAALDALRAHPAMAQARTVLHGWADSARAELAGLPENAARRALEALCDAVVARTA